MPGFNISPPCLAGQLELDHERGTDSDNECSDNEYSISDGIGISDGRTIRRPSNRSVSPLLNQVGEEVMNEVGPNNVVESDEFVLAIQGGACPQLVAPVLLSSTGSGAGDECAPVIQG